MSEKMDWSRCDAIGCDKDPIYLIEIKDMQSIIEPENKYIAQVRVCYNHYDLQSRSQNFVRIVKTRRNNK